LSPEQYAQSIADTDGSAVFSAMILSISENIYGKIRAYSPSGAIFPGHWQPMSLVVLRHSPEIAERFGESECPEIDIPGSAAVIPG
jgi:hypothetical protein